jgi:hypothetical protein
MKRAEYIEGGLARTKEVIPVFEGAPSKLCLGGDF